MATKAEFDTLAAQINADLDAFAGGPPGPQEFVYTLSSGYVVTINDTGIASVKIDSQSVAEGGETIFKGYWFYQPSGGESSLLPILSKSISGLTSPVVRHTHATTEVTYRYTVTGEDILIEAVVKNLSNAPLTITALASPRLLIDNYNNKQTNGLNWTQDHTQSVGTTLSYPSTSVRAAGIYLITPAGGGKPLNFVVWPQQDLSDQFMVLDKNISGLPGRLIVSIFFKPIDVGYSRTFKYTYRFGSSGDWKVLFQGYKDQVRSQALPLKYSIDARPIVQFAAIDTSYIRPDNPYGYNDNHNSPTSQWRRLDLGTQGFVDKVLPGTVACNCQGVLLWQPQGIHPRGVQYRPDFNVFPPVTIPNLPTLVNGFRNAGKDIGLLARPGATITSATWTTDGLQETNPGPLGMVDLNSRLAWALALGFNSFYLDSFVGSYERHSILKSMRAYLGSEVQTYSEFCSVADIPYTARYGVVSKVSGQFILPTEYALLNWLFPEMPWAMSTSFTQDQPLMDFLFTHKLTPFLADYSVSDQATIDLVAPMVAQYIDSNNQWI